MITRPLDLASHLRPEPRRFEWLFLVNVGLLVFFFTFFGSRFVLSPGLGIDFALPQIAGADADARPTSHVITVVNAGQILVRDGLLNIEQLQPWLDAEARRTPHASLLVRASADVPTRILARVLGMAHRAGFAVTLAAEEPAPSTDALQTQR